MKDNGLECCQWQMALPRLVESLGEENFYSLLTDATQQVADYESSVVIIYKADQCPAVVFDNLPGDDSLGYRRDLPAEYVLDPYFTLFENHSPGGIYRLEDIAPDHFFQSEIYKTYYAPQGIKDETGIFCQLDKSRYLLIDMANRHQGKSDIHNIQQLQTLYPVISSLILKHEAWRSYSGGNDQLIGVPLNRAFYNFGKDYLSGRECEVVQLILKGHSSKSIARLLEISEDTVKVHRKRFHAKLDISSQAELFSLFLEAIALVPFGGDEDPLSLYFNGERTSSHD